MGQVSSGISFASWHHRRMRWKTILRTLAATLLLVVAIAGAGFVWVKYAPRHTPTGQPSLSQLDPENLPAFRDAFNAASDKTRLIVLLSPT